MNCYQRSSNIKIYVQKEGIIMLEFSIITISSFVTMLDEFVKTFAKLVFKKDISKYIPIFSVVFGVILGIVGYYIPDVAMGNNIVEAIFIGISAGSAATGVNQIGKQLNKTDAPSIDLGKFIEDQTEVIDGVDEDEVDINGTEEEHTEEICDSSEDEDE